MSAPNSPKVFVSYSWTDDAHVKWVLALATRLRDEGIDVILDQWKLIEGHDKYTFMEQMVTDKEITKVLAISDKRYAEKADGRQGGVGTETQILSQELYDRVKQEKVVPILRERDEDGKECLPVFLRNRKYIDFSDDSNYEEAYTRLIRNIIGKPELKEPPLGKIPEHLLADDAPPLRAAAKFTRLKDAVEKQRPRTHVLLQEYLDTVLDSLEDFRLNDHTRDHVTFHREVIASVTDYLPHRNNFVDFVGWWENYMADEESFDQVMGFLDQLLAFQNRPESVRSWTEDSTDNYRFIIWELYLYLIARLIKERKYALAARFIEAEYTYSDTLGGTRVLIAGAGAFHSPIRSLTPQRRQAAAPDAKEASELLIERATHPKVSFRDLFQVDMLLFIRPYFPNPGHCREWYPRCLRHGWQLGTLEIFARANAARGFAAAGELLKVASLHDLAQRTVNMPARQEVQRVWRLRGAAPPVRRAVWH